MIMMRTKSYWMSNKIQRKTSQMNHSHSKYCIKIYILEKKTRMVVYIESEQKKKQLANSRNETAKKNPHFK